MFSILRVEKHLYLYFCTTKQDPLINSLLGQKWFVQKIWRWRRHTDCLTECQIIFLIFRVLNKGFSLLDIFSAVAYWLFLFIMSYKKIKNTIDFRFFFWFSYQRTLKCSLKQRAKCFYFLFLLYFLVGKSTRNFICCLSENHI